MECPVYALSQQSPQQDSSNQESCNHTSTNASNSKREQHSHDVFRYAGDSDYAKTQAAMTCFTRHHSKRCQVESAGFTNEVIPNWVEESCSLPAVDGNVENEPHSNEDVVFVVVE